MNMRAHQMLKKKESGFTLVEVMIVIAVFGIMSAIAIPSFMSLLPGMRLNGSARGVFVALNKARMGAVSKKSTGNVQFNSSTAYVSWVDNPAGSQYSLDSIDYEETHGTTESGVTISHDVPFSTFAFNSRGLPAGSSVASTITLTNSEGAVQTVEINALGITKMP